MGKKETLMSIDDANNELAETENLPSIEDANNELKKKSEPEQTSETPTSTGTTDGQLTSEMLGFAPPSTLKKVEKVKVDQTTNLPTTKPSYKWTPAGSMPSTADKVEAPYKDQKTTAEKEQEKQVQFEQSTYSQVENIVPKARPEDEVFQVSEKIYSNAPTTTKKTFDEYLSHLYTQDPDMYGQIKKDAEGEDGIPEDKKLQYIKNALNFKAQQVDSDIKILKSRGAEGIAEQFSDKQETLEKILAEYDPVLKQYEQLSNDLKVVQAEYETAKDPVRKAALETMNNDIVAQVTELQPQVDKFNEKYGPEKESYDKYIADNKDLLTKWGEVVADATEINKESEQNIKDHPKAYAEMLKQQKYEQDLEWDQMTFEMTGQPIYNRVAEETAKAMWNKVVDAGTGLLEFSKTMPSMISPLSELIPGVDDFTDRATDEVSGFMKDYLKATTSEKPMIKENGDIDWTRVMPSVAGTVTDMAILLVGANKFSAGLKALKMGGSIADHAGIIGSSMLQTYDDYKFMAEENGYSEKDAIRFGLSTAALVSSLEVISPTKALRGSPIESMALKNAFAELKKNGYKGAIKTFYDYVLKEIGKENLQELTQGYAEKVAGMFMNAMNAGDDTKTQLEDTMSYNEIKETILLTTVVTGLMTGGSHYGNKSAIRNSALVTAAENFGKFKQMLDKGVFEGTIDRVDADRMIAEVSATMVNLEKMPDDISIEKKQELLPLMSKKEKLVEEKKTLDENFAPKIEEKIEKINAEIKTIINAPSTRSEKGEKKPVKKEEKVPEPVATEEKIEVPVVAPAVVEEVKTEEPRVAVKPEDDIETKITRLKEEMGEEYTEEIGNAVRKKLSEGKTVSDEEIETIISYAPMRSTAVKFGDTKAFESPQHKRLVTVTRNLAKALGVEVSNEQETNGGYEENGKRVVEPSRRIRVKGDKKKIRLFAALLGVMAPEMQHSVLTHTYKSGGVGVEAVFAFENDKDAESFQEEMRALGEGNFNYDPKTKELSLVKLDEKISDEFYSLIEKAKQDGRIKGFRKRDSEGEFIGEKEFEGIINEARGSGRHEGSGGTDLDILLQHASTRSRRLSRDYGEKLEQKKGDASTRVKEYVKKMAEKFGLLPEMKTGPVKVSDALHKKISDAYDALQEDNSGDPKVKEAYDALAKEVDAQFDFLVNTIGVKVEFIKDDPYKNSDEMFEDILKNNRLKIFQGGEPHAFLEQKDVSGYSYNEKLRAVHDYFGHFVESNQFGKDGEERAWVAHSKMFSPLAQRALSTETRGQNAWVNMSGANKEALELFREGNKLINEGKVKEGEEIVQRGKSIFQFAKQKVDLLPEELTDATIYESKAEEPPPTKTETTEELPPLKGDEKSLLNRIYKSKKVTGDTKKKLEKFGLSYSIFTNEESSQIADAILEEVGIDRAVVMASDMSNELRGAVRTMLYAKIIDHYFNEEQKATTEEKKEKFAALQGEIANLLDEYARDSGQSIQAISHFYRVSPLAIVMKITKQIEKINEEELTKKRGILGSKQSWKEKISTLKEKLSKEPKIKKRSGGKKNVFSMTESERNDRIAELKDKWKNKKGPGLTSGGLDPEAIEIAGELGLHYVLKGAITFSKWSKKMMADLGITEQQAKEVWENTKVPEDDKGRSIKDYVAQELMEEIRAQHMAELEKMFPESRIEKNNPKARAARKKEFEKILNGIDALKNEEGEIIDVDNFEKLFYSRLGLVDPNIPEIRAKLQAFSKKIGESEPGLFRDRATIEMLDYINNLKRENRLTLGYPIIYANMLYGYETHLRNMQWNLGSAMLFHMGLLTLRNPRFAGTLWKSFFKGLKRGSVEAREIFATGYDKTGAPVIERDLIERMEKEGFLKVLWHYTVPFRALRASDALFNMAVSEAKTAQMFIKEALLLNSTLPPHEQKSRKQIVAEVNDLMYDTEGRKAQAEKQAERETEKFYSLEDIFIDGKRNPKYVSAQYNPMYRNYKRRVYEIMEQSRPLDIVTDAKDWADRALLIGKPKGYLGALAAGLNTLFGAMPAVKMFTMPFVNVPMNIANFMIDWSPLGFISAIHGKEGALIPEQWKKKHGIQAELTPDQKKELMIKATVSTTGMAVIWLLTQLKYRDDEGEERPLLVVYADGVGDYAKNEELKRAGTGFEPYTLDFAGVRMSYKSSPLVAWFASVGYFQDYERFKGGSEKSMAKKIAVASLGHLTMVGEQANLSGLKDLLNFGDQAGAFADDEDRISKMIVNVQKGAFKMLKNLVVPNYVSQANNDVRGIMDLNDKRAMDPWEVLVKDVPIVDQILRNRVDHFGRPVKDEFDMPFYPKGPRPADKFYQLIFEKEYQGKLKFYNDKAIFLGDEESEVTRQQVDDINKIRGKYVLDALEDPKKHTDLGGKTTFEYLKSLDKAEFEKAMGYLFSQGTWEGKDKIFGQGVWAEREREEKPKDESTEKRKFRKFKRMYEYEEGVEFRKKEKKK